MADATPDFSAKHPLEHTWTLWFDNPNGRQKQATWGQTLRSVYTGNTVEDFWCLYNNILAPSRLIMGTDFHLFKEGIEPKWEDATCAKGGKWTFFFPKSKEPAHLDDCWLNLLLWPGRAASSFASRARSAGRDLRAPKQAQDRALDEDGVQRGGPDCHRAPLPCVLEMPENEKIGYMVLAGALARLERPRSKDRYASSWMTRG